MHFNFIASDHFDTAVLHTIDSFVDHFPGLQTVWLADENELLLLLQQLGFSDIPVYTFDNLFFCKYWDLSAFQFPVFTGESYDHFYENWIQHTGRENTMNEYGSLLFLQGLAPEWNQRKYRLVILENNASA